MNKLNLTLLAIGIAAISLTLASATVIAADVAYIKEDSSEVETRLTNALDSLSLSYDVISDSEIPSTDLSQYYMLLIVEDVGNKELIDFEAQHALFLHRDIAEEVWPEVQTIYTTNAREIKIVRPEHQVFEDITIPADGVIDVYGGTGSDMHALRVKPAYVESLAIRTTHNRAVIAQSIRNIGGYPVRDLFFGIPDVESWNTNDDLMFINALQFLMAEIDQDMDGYLYQEDCNDLNPNIYPGAPEIPYDGIDQDCSGFDLLDLDNDGYCKEGSIIQNSLFQCASEPGLIGTDCADDDPVINPDHPDKTQNCINDAPEFTDVPESLEFNEGELVEFNVSAVDPEGDPIEFDIDDERFSVEGNTFTWQTGYEDSGFYIFTINATDGDLVTETTTTLNLLNMNAPPVYTPIPDVVWDEETMASLNLSEYFTDSDSPEIEFGIEEYPNTTFIEVEFEDDEVILFTPADDYFGEDTIVFYADDGNSRTLSEEVNLIVTNINDPVTFQGTIENISFNEDQPLEDAFNLYDYFIDTDSELNFQSFGNENITIEVVDGIVSFYPDRDYYGVEEVYFEADDGEFSDTSNTFTITVYEQGEPPEFEPLDCTTALEEDMTYNCTLSATDLENNSLTYSVAAEDNLQCDISGDTLIYNSYPDYFGEASCTLRVSDIHGYDELPLEVTINPINDAPRIVSYTPEESVVHVVEGWNQTFTIQAFDVDSEEILTDWYKSSVSVENSTQNTSSYTLISPQIGNYLIEAIVRDSQSYTQQSWNVVVGPIEDFTCQDVGGNICSEGTMCGVPTLGVSDTGDCCPTQCIPSFDDANSCKDISENIEIDIKNFDNEIELGEIIEVEFEITNDLEEEQDFEIEVHLYNMESDRSEISAETDVEVRSERSRTVRLDLELPKDLEIEEDDFSIIVIVEDEECSQAYESVGIDRKENSVEITEFDLPNEAICGEAIEADLRVENFGSEEQNIKLTLDSNDLEVDEEINFVLEEYGGEDRETKRFSLEIPNNIESGEYELKARIDYAIDEFETLSETIRIECAKEQVRSSTQVPETISNDKITLNRVEGQEPAPEVEEEINYIPLAILGTLNVLLLGSGAILYLAYRRKN